MMKQYTIGSHYASLMPTEFFLIIQNSSELQGLEAILFPVILFLVTYRTNLDVQWDVIRKY